MLRIDRQFATVGVVLVFAGWAGGAWFLSTAPALPVKAHVLHAVVPAPLPNESVPAVTTTPLWHALSGGQQKVLLPLQNEWDALDSDRQRKWKKIADRYSSMTPAQQQRVQKRMREWVNLTPGQRAAARKNYVRTGALKTVNHTTEWQAYQRLTEGQKKQLSAMSRKASTYLTAITVPAAGSESRGR